MGIIKFISKLFCKRKSSTTLLEERKGKPAISRQTKTEKAYLLLFSASWCGPSIRFKKQIEEGGIDFYSYIDVDTNEELCTKYSIQSVPTTILMNLNGEVLKRWVGEDDEDPGQSKFVDYIKNCGYDIIEYPLVSKQAPKASHLQNDNSDTELKADSLIERALGSPDHPIRVEKKTLKDGSTYTGEAYTAKDGNYCPHGFGKQIISKDLEITGHFQHGYANGVIYANMHFAMVTGRYINGRPDGWIVSAENGVIFGVFKGDDFVQALTEQIMWIQDEYREYHGNVIGVYPKRKTIIFGQPFKAQDGIVIRQAIGAQFTSDGDVYVGADQNGLSKTGYFVKYGHDGYITIGYFVNGVLQNELTWHELLSHYPNANNAKNRAIQINTTKKYF